MKAVILSKLGNGVEISSVSKPFPDLDKITAFINTPISQLIFNFI